MTTSTVPNVQSLVRFIPGDETAQPRDGIALCLSGGGYRVMLFHLGPFGASMNW
jgi:NTE family protein